VNFRGRKGASLPPACQLPDFPQPRLGCQPPAALAPEPPTPDQAGQDEAEDEAGDEEEGGPST